MSSAWEAVIGLEIHVQLNTQTKMFCGCPVGFGGEPNTRVCPVCLGHPGTLPVINEKAVEYATRIALALDCRIAGHTLFHRKNDFNRGGTPLVEIVTEPDLSSPERARVFLTQLRSLIEHLGVSDVNMEEGSLRCDANVSVRRHGEALGVKTELKNMNSFRFLQRGLESEIVRQIELLESGETVEQATVHFDPQTGQISTLRSKEEAHDYRYFLEPDLVSIELDEAYVEKVRRDLPELPAARKERLAHDYGIPMEDAQILSVNRPLGDYFERVACEFGDAKLAANWVTGDFAAYLNAEDLEVGESRVGPDGMVELLELVADGTLSGKMAKKVFTIMISSDSSAAEIVEEEGLGQISDEGALEEMVVEIIAANPEAVEEFGQGRSKILGFFVGQAMKKTKGQANPQLVNELFRRHLQRSL